VKAAIFKSQDAIHALRVHIHYATCESGTAKDMNSRYNTVMLSAAVMLAILLAFGAIGFFVVIRLIVRLIYRFQKTESSEQRGFEPVIRGWSPDAPKLPDDSRP
jgi:hypothetical protein